MRSILLLAVVATAAHAFMVPQNAPCSGSTVCLISCTMDSRCPVFNLAKPVFLTGTSCSRFFKCESGRACEMECPVGLHFNNVKESCDWPHQACCDSSIECRADQPIEDPEPPVPEPPAPVPPVPPTPPSPVQPPILVPPCSGGSICLLNCVADSRCPAFNPPKPLLLKGNSCDRFYKCESGRACEMQCPGGTHFNEKEKACDWPHQACCDPTVECRPDPCRPGSDCGAPIPPKPTPPPPVWPTPPAPCSGGSICGLNCPVDNRCPPFNGAKPVLLPGQSCDRYLKCESGRACPMYCPPGLHFNVNKQICDWPFQACCDPRIECRPDPCPPGAFGCGQNNQNNHNNNWLWG